MSALYKVMGEIESVKEARDTVKAIFKASHEKNKHIFTEEGANY